MVRELHRCRIGRSRLYLVFGLWNLTSGDNLPWKSAGATSYRTVEGDKGVTTTILIERNPVLMQTNDLMEQPASILRSLNTSCKT